MGMSQNGPVSAEGYVSLITLNNSPQPPPAPFDQPLLQPSDSDQAVLLSQPLHSFTHIGGDEQTLLILPSQSPNDMVLKNSQPQLLLLDVPGSGQSYLQGASVVQIQQPNQQLSLIHAPTLNLVQPSVELVHFPGNTIFLTESGDQPLILCLQNAAQPLSLQQSFDGQTFVVDEVIQTAAAADVTLNQVAMAKSWHNDADLVNRAMLALNRQPPAVASHIPFDQLQLNCSPGHRLPCDKDARLLTES